MRPKPFAKRDRLGDFYYRFSCGENGADVYDRASLFLDTLVREMDNGCHDATQNMIIVSHSLFMRFFFLMRYFHWTVNDIDKNRSFLNGEICRLTQIDGVYTLNGHMKAASQQA
jgi:broad specificity phosphatase PhoE